MLKGIMLIEDIKSSIGHAKEEINSLPPDIVTYSWDDKRIEISNRLLSLALSVLDDNKHSEELMIELNVVAECIEQLGDMYK